MSTRRPALAAGGEPYVWLTGAGLAISTLMIVGLLLLVLVSGARTFWPRPLIELQLADGSRLAGEVTRRESYRIPDAELEALPPETRRRLRTPGGDGFSERRLLRVGNYDLYGEDFRWVPDFLVRTERRPADLWMIERREWGSAIGRPLELRDGERVLASGPKQIAELFPGLHRAALGRLDEIRRIERREIAAIDSRLERERLEVRKAAIEHGSGSAVHRGAAAHAADAEGRAGREREGLERRILALRAEDGRYRLVVREIGGALLPERPGGSSDSDAAAPLLVSQVVRAYPANALSLWGEMEIYLSRWWEYLSSEPREANTEGGVMPAIFGTFMMTVIMSLVVTPFGVVAALYLREYAQQGILVSAVRIAVNNLAGVPSIVYGVFGLGFFCYAVGGTIDSVFFAESLPAPTFGTGGILWASLTLALLTVPVVIVATEESLAAVPGSMREASFACGASKWQTIRRIVLPRATPGIMTGLILAMARGAGEVAPLMITGVVKLAPELPLDGRFPFLHLERSFMHLGFHIYDVGFQSRNSEAGKPMVFTTTLLLILLICSFNLFAVRWRTRLKQRYRSAAF